jgi:hypothetical protein
MQPELLPHGRSICLAFVLGLIFVDMSAYPQLSDQWRLGRLAPPAGRVRMVLDTDTYNEIDDQFAVAHVVGSPEQMSVEAIYAAPFQNQRSSGPGDGMEKSFDEINRLLKLMKKLANPAPPVFRGATRYLVSDNPEPTDATRDLIARAMSMPRDQPLYVVAIGAITNVASAIMLEPKIIEKIVVVWLGGHALNWRDTREFNMNQDIPASQVILDCGVPLVLLPCVGVVDHLLTTVPELEAHMRGKGELADYLFEITRDYNHRKQPVWSKVIWDVAATAYLVNPNWIDAPLLASPILTRDGTWSVDPGRHLIRVARRISRDAILSDVFTKIAAM